MSTLETYAAADGFAAIGSEIRLDVLKLLVRAGADGLTIGEMQRRSGLAPSTLAHHLRSLTHAGLVRQERRGRSTINTANYDRLERLAEYILSECCADSRDRGGQA